MKKLISTIFILIFISAATIVSGYAYNRLLSQDTYDIMNKGFYLNGDDTVTLSYGQSYDEEGFTAIVDDKQCAKDISVKDNIDTTRLGNYEVTYTMKQNGVSKTMVRHVNIVDDTPPEIKINCDKNVNIVVGSKYETCMDFTVSDNYDQILKDKVQIINNVDTSTKGDYKVTYKVSDNSGNETTEVINVHVKSKVELNYIVIYISKQKLYYYEDGKLVLSSPVTTGRNNATRTGNFKIKKKARNTTLKGKDYESKVQYWMGYDGNSFGIHDASWRSRFGGMDYKTNGSHGCVNVPTNVAAKLYDYVEIGTPVYIKK